MTAQPHVFLSSESPQIPRILIVDDQPDNLRVIGEILSNTGRYKVNFANNGKDAIQQVEKLKPDLVLLDVMMPGLNGFDVCRYLKQNPLTHAIPIIFLTALETADNIGEAFDIGGADYVQKPFESNTLLARVEAHLKAYQYHRLEKERRREERFNSYRNGMVEIASELLHHLGNLMVSLKATSASLVDLEKPLEELTRVLQSGHTLLINGEINKAERLMDNLSGILGERIAQVFKSEGDKLLDTVREMEKLITHQRKIIDEGMRSSLFPCSALLSDLEFMLKKNLEDCVVRLTADIAVDYEVKLPRVSLLSALFEILKNGCEAIRESREQSLLVGEGDVSLKVLGPQSEGDEQSMQLEIVDNGIGISEDVLSQVTEARFSTKSSHAGLGLHNAANFILYMKGSLTIHSDGLGKGTVVRIKLPRIVNGG